MSFERNIYPILNADYRDAETIKDLLRDGADVNVYNVLKNNALHLAILAHRADNSCLDSIRLLLNAGINANLVNKRGVTPLDRAVRFRYINIVELLLQNGAEVNRENCDYSVLSVSARAQDETLFKLLLGHGASVDFRNADGTTPMDSIGWLTDESIISAVIERTTDINRRTFNGGTPLCSAASHGNAIQVKLLLEAGADISIAVRIINFTPLHVAVHRNLESTYEVVKVLLEKGVKNIEDRDVLNVTPLLYALEKCGVQVIKLLSDYGADFTAKSYLGNSALHHAVKNPCDKVTGLVLDKGIDVNIKNHYGRTALHIAAMFAAPGTCDILLDRGADICCKDDNGKSPLLTYVEERDLRLQNREIPPTELVGLSLIACIAKLEHLNFSIDQDNRQLIELDPDLNKHYEACNCELEKMKCKSVYSGFSVYNILFACNKKMVTFAKNDDLVASFEKLAPRLSEDLHIYFSSMQVKFQNEIWRQRQIKKVQKIISGAMGLNDLSHPICERIASFLEEEDLKKY